MRDVISRYLEPDKQCCTVVNLSVSSTFWKHTICSDGIACTCNLILTANVFKNTIVHLFTLYYQLTMTSRIEGYQTGYCWVCKSWGKLPLCLTSLILVGLLYILPSGQRQCVMMNDSTRYMISYRSLSKNHYALFGLSYSYIL